MEPVNPNISPINQGEQAAGVGFNPALVNGKNKMAFVNDAAFSFTPAISNAVSKFDMITDNVAKFKDLLSVAYDGVSAMKKEGEGIRELIEKAKDEGITPELLDELQAEVDSRLAAIKQIKENTVYDGVNPLQEEFKLDVPDWKDYIKADSAEEANSEIQDMIASFDIDMSIEGDGFNIGGTAKINIGVNKDGALQISVEADMDYDLSGLLDKGLDSDEAMDMINEFLSMLGVTQNDLGTTMNMLDSLWGRTMDSLENSGFGLPEGLEITPDSSSELKGHIAQQASITLAGMANQVPGIAINIL